MSILQDVRLLQAEEQWPDLFDELGQVFNEMGQRLDQLHRAEVDRSGLKWPWGSEQTSWRQPPTVEVLARALRRIATEGPNDGHC